MYQKKKLKTNLKDAESRKFVNMIIHKLEFLALGCLNEVQ